MADQQHAIITDPVDFKVSFDKITNWEFSFQRHTVTSVEEDGLQDLIVAVSEQLEEQGSEGATQADLGSVEFGMAFLLSHKNMFTLGQFLKVLDTSQPAFRELNSIVHNSHTSSIVNNQMLEMKKQIEASKVLAAQMEQMQLNLEAMKLENSKNVHLITKQDQYSANLLEENRQMKNKFADLQNKSSSSPNNPSDAFGSIPNANSTFNFGGTAPAAFAPPHMGHLNNPLTMEDTLKSLTQVLAKEKLSRVKITVNPPIYNPRKHNSMLSFGVREYARWAMTQALSVKESTLFFCMCFEKRIQSEHVQMLAKDDFGQPVYSTLAPLINETIKRLRFHEEDIDMQKDKFGMFQVNPSQDIDDEFLRLFELRKMGWIGESEIEALTATKPKFMRALNIRGNGLHNLVFNRSFSDRWTNATDFFEIAVQLRDMESRYKNNPNSRSSGDYHNPKSPTNSSDKMDTSNNLQYQNDFMNNFNENKNQNAQSKQVNQIADRKCKHCKKTFTPAKIQYSCCGMDCVDAWKASRPPRPSKPATKQRGKEYANNMTEKFNNNQEGEVSKDDNFYTTPTHIFSPKCNIPYIVHDALLDSGAGPTLMKFELLKKIGLVHLLKNVERTILGGDEKPLVGLRGEVEVEIALEDSTGNFTNKFLQKILVYDNLNNDLVIGRDSCRNTRQITMFPMLNKILINPSVNTIKAFRCDLRDQVRSANNVLAVNVLASKNFQESDNNSRKQDSSDNRSNSLTQIKKPKLIPTIKTGDMSTEIQFNDENGQFVFNVPGAKKNEAVWLEKIKEIEVLTSNFMNQAQEYSVNNFEDSEKTALSEVITEGGLDGLIDKTQITVTETKTFISNKGEVKVGKQISRLMEARFKKFIDDYKGEVFDATVLGETKQTCHPELKPDAKPFGANPKYMPLNPFMQSEAKVLVQKMVDMGVLEECNQPANSTIFIVQKNSGKWRLIADLRKYNDRIQDFVVHLPSPYELINRICKFELFSYVDFPEAYFNVPLSKESIKNNPIIASVSGQQYNFKYLKMAQGLKIATSTFINILNEVYAEIMDYVINYLDDSVVGTVNDEEIHFKKLKKFIEITDRAGLKLSLKKSCFFAMDLNFLNYTITNGAWGISDSQRNTINALNVDRLTQTKRESLAAFINHFNRFDTGVAFAARKIRDKNTSADAVKSILDNIKRKLTESPALQSVNFEDELHIYTDASNFDVSGSIFQKNKNGRFNLVTCFSKKIPEAMLDKPIPEKELWALQQVAKTYRYLFIGKHKKVFWNDNKTVLSAKHSKAPSLRCLFDTISSVFSNVEFKYVSTDKNASDIFTRVNSIASRTRGSTSVYKMSEPIKAKILRMHQNAGCMAPKRLLSTFQGLGETDLKMTDVVEVLKTCETCKHIENHKAPRKAAPGITMPKESTSNCSIYIDHKTILNTHRRDKINDKNSDPNWVPDNKEQSCLSIFEPVSCTYQFYPVADYSAETVKEAIRNYFVQNGPSKNVIADNAPCFVTLKSWLKDKFNSDLHHTSGYRPQANLSERMHREFERVLKTYNTEKQEFGYEDWADNLAQACISMNSMKHSVHKMSAYEILKNRVQTSVEPPEFHPTGFERVVLNEKFLNKAEKLFKSNLKMTLPVYKKGQKVKVTLPKQNVRFGIVTATKDNSSKKAVTIKFPDQRAISISKDHICVPRYQDDNAAQESSVDNQNDTSVNIEADEVEYGVDENEQFGNEM